MDVTLLIGAGPYPLPDHKAAELRDRIRAFAAGDRMLGYLADGAL